MTMLSRKSPSILSFRSDHRPIVSGLYGRINAGAPKYAIRGLKYLLRAFGRRYLSTVYQITGYAREHDQQDRIDLAQRSQKDRAENQPALVVDKGDRSEQHGACQCDHGQNHRPHAVHDSADVGIVPQGQIKARQYDHQRHGGQADGRRRYDRSPDAAGHDVADIGRAVDRDRPGRHLRNGDDVGQLLVRDPAVGDHHLVLNQRQHRIPPAEAEKADAILMRSTDLHGYELPESIRAIARCGAGVNNIPIEEYAKKGVVVFNSPGANSNAVKELVLAMLVLSSRGVVQSMNWVRENAADPDIFVNAEKAKKAFVGRELKGKSIAVIGLGNVGSKVANACADLGMDVYGYDPFISVEHAWALSQKVQRVSTLEDACRDRDYLTLHVPSKADTIHMIGEEQLNLLAPDAVLINYSRETIVDEDAVDAALRAGRIAWFATDFATQKTVLMPNTFITTHSGAGTGEAEANCADMAISELKDYLENGNIANSVNYPPCSMGKARAASRVACLHANVPNMIGQITAVLARDNANVQRMTNESAGENAYTMFDTDEHLDDETIEALKQIPSIYRVRVIK